jgi:hypothetical protein
MIKIKVKNLGNIKAGYKENDGFIDITKVTIFTGEGLGYLDHLFFSLLKIDPSLKRINHIEQFFSPTKQKKYLYEKLEWVNKKEDNILIFTTHSPYILNALTLAFIAKEIKNQNIVPKESCIDAKDVSIYELTRNGIIDKLPIVDGLPSDDNYLNNHLAKSNDLFDQLLELETNYA